MRVLRVVDGVLARLAPRQVDIELHLRIGRTQQKEVAHGVGPNFVEHLLQRDADPGAAGHPHCFLSPLDRHQLDQQDGEPLRIDPEYRERLPHATDLALVIGAPDVHHAVEAPLLELVPVIEDVRPEVGRVAITLDDHLVLSAVGLEPGGAIMLGYSPQR